MKPLSSAALLACLVAAATALAGPAAPALPQDAPVPKELEGKGKKTYQIGSPIPSSLKLPDLDGKERRVFPEESEPIVVLAWWSLRDPLCRKAEPKLVKLAADYARHGVSLYLVESNYDELVAGVGDPLDKVKKFRKDAKLKLPLLIDRGNKVADDFDALSSNQVFVIDKARVLRYSGAIDNDPESRLRDEARVDYLRDALEAILDGKPVENALTRAKGRKLKRERKPEAATK
ncbi:MAG: redoxin domain-containing protein [Planctomycetota bacterium]